MCTMYCPYHPLCTRARATPLTSQAAQVALDMTGALHPYFEEPMSDERQDWLPTSEAHVRAPRQSNMRAGPLHVHRLSSSLLHPPRGNQYAIQESKGGLF